jgi:hypothetical protein
MGETKYTCQITVILGCIRFKPGLARMSCLDHGGGKIHSCTLHHSEITRCVHESLAAVHQPLDMYFQTELFATANREEGPLSQIRNHEN